MKLIFLDLDGTLLDDQKRISPATRAALERCAALGMQIVPATGRFYDGIPQEVRELPFVRYVVAVNGAQVRDVAENRVLRRAELPLDTALRVYDRLDCLPVIYECYLDDRGYMPAAFYGQIEDYIEDRHVRRMVRQLREPVAEFRAFLREKNRPLQKIQMFFRDGAACRAAFPAMSAEFPETAVTSSIPNAIELTDRAATKGEALRFLCGYLGVDVRETVAFGDSRNDVELLKAAGLGVAMGNAEPELLAAADCVTDKNTRDGIAKALERLLAGQ